MCKVSRPEVAFEVITAFRLLFSVAAVKAVVSVGRVLAAVHTVHQDRSGQCRAGGTAVHTVHFTEKHMTKQDLRSYQHIKTEISQIEGQLRELSSRVYSPRAPHLTGMPGAASTERGSAQERAATELFELREHYEKKIRELNEKQLKIERAIDTLPDPFQTIVLRAHYINGEKWEKVCLTASASWRTVHRAHAKALEMLARYGTL